MSISNSRACQAQWSLPEKNGLRDWEIEAAIYRKAFAFIDASEAGLAMLGSAAFPVTESGREFAVIETASLFDMAFARKKFTQQPSKVDFC